MIARYKIFLTRLFQVFCACFFTTFVIDFSQLLWFPFTKLLCLPGTRLRKSWDQGNRRITPTFLESKAHSGNSILIENIKLDLKANKPNQTENWKLMACLRFNHLTSVWKSSLFSRRKISRHCTTLHPKSPLKISNSHRYFKTCENLANSHRFFTDVFHSSHEEGCESVNWRGVTYVHPGKELV